MVEPYGVASVAVRQGGKELITCEPTARSGGGGSGSTLGSNLPEEMHETYVHRSLRISAPRHSTAISFCFGTSASTCLGGVDRFCRRPAHRTGLDLRLELRAAGGHLEALMSGARCTGVAGVTFPLKCIDSGCRDRDVTRRRSERTVDAETRSATPSRSPGHRVASRPPPLPAGWRSRWIGTPSDAIDSRSGSRTLVSDQTVSAICPVERACEKRSASPWSLVTARYDGGVFPPTIVAPSRSACQP